MKPLELTHVQGCWVKRLRPGGEEEIGVVKMAIPETGKTQVHWIRAGSASFVDSDALKSGFVNGQDVLDATPGTGVRSLGQGAIMQLRDLAGSEQALVDFPEKGERHWLPYQYLRQVKGVRHRFVTAQMGGEADAERVRLRLLAHAIKVWNENTGSLSHLEIDPLPHQINLVHHILASNNLSWLIADDVGLGKTIEAGMVFAIEPMITLGSEKTKVLDDNWTVVTQDKSYGAHFENSYCIAPDGKPFVLSVEDGGKAQLARFGIEVSSLLS